MMSILSKDSKVANDNYCTAPVTGCLTLKMRHLETCGELYDTHLLSLILYNTTKQDVEFHDYCIPKDAHVTSFNYGINQDQGV
jgi:hypothetical protein